MFKKILEFFSATEKSFADENPELTEGLSDPRETPVYGVVYKGNTPEPLLSSKIPILCVVLLLGWIPIFLHDKEPGFFFIVMAACLLCTVVVCVNMFIKKNIPLLLLYIGGAAAGAGILYGSIGLLSQIFQTAGTKPSLIFALANLSIIVSAILYIRIFQIEMKRKVWTSLPPNVFWKTPRFYGIPGHIGKDDTDITDDDIDEQQTGITVAKALARFALKHPGVFVFNNAHVTTNGRIKLHHVVIIGRNVLVVEDKTWDSGHDYEMLPGVALQDKKMFRNGNIRVLEKIEHIRRALKNVDVNVQGFVVVNINHGSIYCHPGSVAAIPVWDLENVLEQALCNDGILKGWIVEAKSEPENKNFVADYIYEPAVREVHSKLGSDSPEWAYLTLCSFATENLDNAQMEESSSTEVVVPLTNEIQQWFVCLEGGSVADNEEEIDGVVASAVDALTPIVKTWKESKDNALYQDKTSPFVVTFSENSVLVQEALTHMAPLLIEYPEGIPEEIVSIYIQAHECITKLFISFKKMAETISQGVLSDEWFANLDSVNINIEEYEQWEEERKDFLSQLVDFLKTNRN